MQKVQNDYGFFNDTFLVICGDAIIDTDFTEVVKIHKDNKALSSVILKKVLSNEVSKYGVVLLDSKQKIISFQEKPSIQEAKSNLVNTGIYIFEPEIFNHIPNGINYDIGSELFPKLVNNSEQLYGIEVPFQWIDIGTMDDYYKANVMALNGEINGLIFKNKGLIFDSNLNTIDKEDLNISLNKNKKQNTKMTTVILSGGNGTRMWPVSRVLMPKQFVKIFGTDSLFQQTVKRNASFSEKIIIVSNELQKFLALDQLEEIPTIKSQFISSDQPITDNQIQPASIDL
jgi:NDP-sugar pyrophosphorylase family protein